MLFICIHTTIYGKYIIEETITVARIDIDRNDPKIECININNTNVEYPAYANKNHTITLEIKVIEKNIKENYFNKEHMAIMVGENKVNPTTFEIKEKFKKEDEIIYEVTLKGIDNNGILKVKIDEGTIVDKSENVNEEMIVNTQILIDNIAPKGNFEEKELDKGKVQAIIISNEGIRKNDGWTLSENQKILTKEFTNNVAYTLDIIDFAQNTSKIEINITKATYINITYASHNSEIGWTFGYGNYDIAGKEAVQIDPSYKTEALAFNIEGNIDKDFVQMNAYVFTHWGEGSQGVCADSGMIYNYGYNPSSTTYKSMLSKDLVTISGKKYIQFGGARINGEEQRDINGNNPISKETWLKHPYGISAIRMKLKDYSYYSIVYQIFVNEVGWLKPASDGEETKYNHKIPMSAIRMTLVPKSEKKYIIEAWEKDVGTFNM